MHPVGFRNPSIIQMYIGADIHSLWSEIDSSRYWIYTKVLSAKLRAHGQIKGCFIMNFKTSDLLQEYKYFELIGTFNHFVKLSHSPNSSLSRLRYSYCYHVDFFLCFFFQIYTPRNMKQNYKIFSAYLIQGEGVHNIFSEGYRRYLALCLTSLVSQSVRFCFFATSRRDVRRS